MSGRPLTVPCSARYKAALAAVWLVAPMSSQAARVAGAVVPEEARLVEPHRYRAGRSYEETLKFYKTIYPPPKYGRKPIVNQPGVRAVHIANPAPRPGSWDGINVYELGGEARIFILVAPGEASKETGGQRDRRK